MVSRTSQGSRQKGDAFRRMLSQKTSITAQVDTLFLAVKSLDTNKVISILQRLETEDSLQISSLTDAEGYTLIHKAAFENSYRISEYLITYYKNRLTTNSTELMERGKLGKGFDHQAI